MGLRRPCARAALLGLLALAACDAAPSTVAGEPEAPRAAEFRSARVGEAIEAASEVVRTRGFAEDGPASRGFLVDQAAAIDERSMRAGTCYLVLAAASEAMRELNVRVFDSDGSEVISDATTGSRAAVRYCPSQSGTYFVSVHASAGSGLYEVRTFRGPTGLDIRIDDLFRDVGDEPQRETR